MDFSTSTKMQSKVSFPTEHKDLVHYVAYDFYGQRLATCSSDHTIRVWNLENGNWVLADELKVGQQPSL